MSVAKRVFRPYFLFQGVGINQIQEKKSLMEWTGCNFPTSLIYYHVENVFPFGARKLQKNSRIYSESACKLVRIKSPISSNYE